MTFAESVAGKLTGFAKPVHRKLRGQKIEMFLGLIQKYGRKGRLLDVGGDPGIDGEFLELYAKFNEVVVVNLTSKTFAAPAGVSVKTLTADGRDLPMESRSFDWVFSNAVIEHVGAWEHQGRFAREIRRVASRGYFVATPNKYFPIEPHALLPFYQFLPVTLQKKVAPYSPGYLRQYEEIHLLSTKQLQTLFPEAAVSSVGFPVIGNSLVAYHAAD
jgi:hypothetical protein